MVFNYLIDRFIPEQAALESKKLFNELFKYRFIIASCHLSVLVGMSVLAWKITTEGIQHFSIYLTFVAVIGYVAVPFGIRKFSTYRIGIYYHTLFYLLILPIRVSQTGGFESAYFMFVPILPIISTFLVSPRFTIAITFGVLASTNGLILFNSQYEFLPVDQINNTTGFLVALVTTNVSILFMSLIGLQKQKGIERLASQLSELKKLQAEKLANERKEAYFEMVKSYHKKFLEPTQSLKTKLEGYVSQTKVVSETELDQIESYLKQLNGISNNIRESVDLVLSNGSSVKAHPPVESEDEVA